jgi:hypothetical protein
MFAPREDLGESCGHIGGHFFLLSGSITIISLLRAYSLAYMSSPYYLAQNP